MSVERMFKWSCNSAICNAVLETPHHGGAKGWHWYMAEGEIQHACGKCSANMLANGWATSKTDNNQLTFNTGFMPHSIAVARFNLPNKPRYKGYHSKAPMRAYTLHKDSKWIDLLFWNGQAWVYLATIFRAK